MQDPGPPPPALARRRGTLLKAKVSLIRLPPWSYFAISLVGAVALWHFLVVWLQVPSFVVPPPGTVGRSLWLGLVQPIFQGTGLNRTGYLLPLIATMQSTLSGYLIGAALGILVGVILAELRLLERLMMPYVAAFQSLPKVALAPLFVIWFGYGGVARTLLATTLVFFPVMIGTLNGFRQVGTGRIELARSYRSNAWDTIRYIKFPSALPQIMSGLEVSIVYALLGAIASELVSGNEGIGARLLIMLGQADISGMFAMLVLSAVAGSTLNGILRYAKRRLLFWV